ncbi:heme-dependent oxidative N-demethylase family protein [Rhizobium sp. ZW T2_16]|uniref:heme-dependent oxidative N-demethylase family protein n=1 Tax=Rhizobium sp. ZW T2_16 TaxID=3378083 RepID=UPI003853BFD5
MPAPIAPTYTPYDGSSKPFTIGLLQLEPERWIEPDGDLAEQVLLKRNLVAEHGELVLRAEAGTQEAQQEVLDLLIDYLPHYHPENYRLVGNDVRIAGLDPDIADQEMMPLHRAGLLVQDDLVIMRKGENGWRIAAAFLAFPSSWRLSEKFGLSMDEVHAPVPGFEGGSRNAGLINRMFDNLSADRIVVRWNWSVNWSHALYHPDAKSAEEKRGVSADRAVIRVERQTLRKLPVSGDILFTIRIYLDPVSVILAQPNAVELAASMAEQLEAMSDVEVAYKGLTEKRVELVGLLRRTEPVKTLAE